LNQGKPAQSPGQLEQTSVKTLNQAAEVFVGRLASASVSTAADDLAIINFCLQIENFYKSYEPTARQLDAAGLHDLSQRISVLISDIQTAKKTYFEMYQNLLRQIQARNQIMAQAQQESLNIQLAGLQNQSQAFERMNQMWFDANETRPTPRYCPHCGGYLGNFNSYYYCPKCGQIL
jgi:hypothetical protein